jgi:hypothetical protein
MQRIGGQRDLYQIRPAETPARRRLSTRWSGGDERQRKQTPRQIPVHDLPQADRFTRLRTERKYFLDTIKMIAYRAETSMAATVREQLKRSDDARALLRQIYDTEIDLMPDLEAKTLTVHLHHLTQAAHDTAVQDKAY